MKRKLFLALIFTGFTLAMYSQPELPDRVKVKFPEMLKKAHPKMYELEKEFAPGGKWGQKRGLDQFWIVYSDRDKNETYMTPDMNGERSTRALSFGEKVYIADIRDDMALVYTDTKPGSFPVISSTAKSVGWVPMENLLLWNTCPADERGVILKALIAIKLNKMKQNEQFQGRLYQNPEDLRSSRPLSMDMNFYFIMKESKDGTQALLCLQSTFTGNNLYGWVKKNSYTPWNQRTCLEPNWSPSYVDSHKGQKAYVYIDENPVETAIATSWVYGTPNGDDDHFSQYRMNPSQLRFPILSKPTEEGVVRCTAFADKTGNSNSTSAFKDEINKKVNEKGNKMLHMSIILAVEATETMKNYLPAIKDALASCKSYVSQGLTVKVGLVLYRNAGSENDIEIVPLTTPDDARLMATLTEANANGKVSGSDDGVALIKAIETAIDKGKMGVDPDERNMLLLVGKNGDANSSADIQNLVGLLSKNKIQMMSVQVLRTQTGTCAHYTDQIADIVNDNVNIQYKKIGSEARFSPSKNNDGYNFTSTNKGTLLFAQIRQGKMEEALEPTELTRYVNNGISAFAKSMGNYRDRYEKSLNDVDFDPKFLTSILGESGYKVWKEQKAISAYDGYAKLEDNNGAPFWHYILYLSDGELSDLVKKLQDAATAAENRSKDRTPYINAMKAVVKAQLKEEMQMSDKEIENMTPEELDEKIYGINIPTESMDRTTKYSIKDMGNASVVPASEYFDILDKVAKKYRKLSKIKSSNYKYRMVVNNVDYYWIPLEDLP